MVSAHRASFDVVIGIVFLDVHSLDIRAVLNEHYVASVDLGRLSICIFGWGRIVHVPQLLTQFVVGTLVHPFLICKVVDHCGRAGIVLMIGVLNLIHFLRLRATLIAC